VSKQTKLSEPTITEKFPENHKLRMPKKQWLEYHQPKSQTFESIMSKIQELGRDTLVVAYSGGKDSGVVLHKLLDKHKLDSAFYIRTNTGVQITEDFIKDTCQSLGVKLHIREPTPHAFVYVAICLEVGFPDYGLHDMIMSFLKYKTMMKFITEPQFKGKKPILMSGIRQNESTRRKFNYNEPINVDSGKLWFGCPIFYESEEEVYRYYLDNGLKKSPSYDEYPSSFECECGCFAGKGEMEAVRKLDPTRAEFFKWIEEGIKKFGKPTAQRHTTWGGGSWTTKERNEILTKYLGDNTEHIINMGKLVCGSECGAGTMRGVENV